jgi:hypothetical protein
MMIDAKIGEHREPGDDECLTLNVMLGPKATAKVVIVGERINSTHLHKLRDVLWKLEDLWSVDESTPRQPTPRHPTPAADDGAVQAGVSATK